MEPDFRSLVQRLCEQIDMDFAADEEISQDLWDIHVESKVALRNSENIE